MRLMNIYVLFFLFYLLNFNTTYSMEARSSIDLRKIVGDENDELAVKLTTLESEIESIVRKINDEQTNQSLIRVALEDRLSKIKRKRSELKVQLSSSIRRVGLSAVNLRKIAPNSDTGIKSRILERYIALEALVLAKLGEIKD